MPTQIIVFDLYNTLIHIQRKQNPFAEIYRRCQSQLSLSFPAFVDLVLTHSSEELRELLPNSFQPAYEALLPEFEAELQSVVPFPETYAVIAELAESYPLYLISNLATIYKRPFVDSSLSDFFEMAVFSCDVGVRKPDRAIFEEVEKRSGKSGDEIVMVGDSLRSDIGGAKQMNWRYLHIKRQTSRLKLWEIGSLSEIAGKIQS